MFQRQLNKLCNYGEDVHVKNKEEKLALQLQERNLG